MVDIITSMSTDTVLWFKVMLSVFLVATIACIILTSISLILDYRTPKNDEDKSIKELNRECKELEKTLANKLEMERLTARKERLEAHIKKLPVKGCNCLYCDEYKSKK